ncbi:Alginate biosynthesis protein AlgA [compost metagenome]
MADKLHPVILCGGAGTRLWPTSRESHPKPFMELVPGRTLLGDTLRNAAEVSAEETYLILNREHYFMARDIARQSTHAPMRYLKEPVGRNTALAIACASLDVARRHGGDAILLVLPADHVIGEIERLRDAVNRAVISACNGELTIFGIEPDRPETAYGYVEVEGPKQAVNRVIKFIEKPPIGVARQFIADGRHLWNAGMFCGRASAFIEAFSTHAPEVYTAAKNAVNRGNECPEDASFDFRLEDFESAPDISIDFAVFEKLDQIAVVPSNFSWSDVGSWPAIAKSPELAEGASKTGSGRTVLVNATNTFVRAESRIVAAVGTENLIIVETPDAVLVLNPAYAQDVKHVVSTLKADGHEAYRLHAKVHRPWGSYTTLEEGARFKIKRIEVEPGSSLSLQMHHHRSEHWVVVSGTAEVVIDDKEMILRPNESCYIPIGVKHRLINPGKVSLIMIEVQCGDYLGEDDIVRYSDLYGRV